MPAESVAAEIGTSAIAGRGLLATADIVAGEPVVRYPEAPASVDDLGPVNHSCDPNLGWRDATTLAARRSIAAGDELTLDYATVIADGDFTLWCHCETYRCRQVIEGSDWRIPQLQARYAGWWPPAMQRRIDEQGG